MGGILFLCSKNRRMKRTIYLLSLLATILSACNNQPQTTAYGEAQKEAPKPLFKTLEGGEVCYSIGDHYAGEFIIGDEIPDSEYLEHFTIRKETKNKQTEEGSEQENIYVISEKQTDVIYLKPIMEEQDGSQKEVIGEIMVISEKFKTNRGISVNATLADFVAIYPEYSLWYSYVSDIYVLETPEFDGQFMLSSEDYTKEIEVTGDKIELEMADYKPEAKIWKIRVL